MFAGMIAPEKPPLRIANSTSSRDSLRTLKFGPSVRSPPLTLPGGFEPNASADESEWQPAQRSLNSCAPCLTCGSSLLATLILCSAQPLTIAAEATRQQARKRLGLGMGGHIIRRHAQATPRRGGSHARALRLRRRGRRQEGRRRAEEGQRDRRPQPADRLRGRRVLVRAEERDGERRDEQADRRPLRAAQQRLAVPRPAHPEGRPGPRWHADLRPRQGGLRAADARARLLAV